MRIANIIEEGKLGGPQVRIILAAKALEGQVETTVVMPEENSSEFRKRCDKSGIPYKTFKISRITKEWKVAIRYLLFSPVEILRLCHYFKERDFDIIHVSGGSWQYKGVIAGRMAGKKVIWHLNDTSMPYLFRKFFSLFSRFTHGYIYASERSKTYYGSLGQKGKPEFVIPAPVDVSLFDIDREYDGDEDTINRWQNKIVVGTVANISPIKGLEVLICAVSKLNRLCEDIVFVVLGPVFSNQKRYFKKLQKLSSELGVQGNIEFVGSRADIRPLMKRFDVYVCSSLAESSPISVWEAMAMGKPVVSTDVGDVPMYVLEGYNGYIVDVGDSRLFAERIRVLATDKGLRVRFGYRARKAIVRELDVVKCAKRHLKAYRLIAN